MDRMDESMGGSWVLDIKWTGRATRIATGLLAIGIALLLPLGAAAELQRVEAVGTYGIKESMRTRVIAKDEAIAKARWEGVSRVALELIGESSTASDDYNDMSGNGDVPPLETTGTTYSNRDLRDPNDVRLDRVVTSADEAALLRSALGKDMLPYTRSYRILEDQGELPVLFGDAPGVKTEYVVVIEVIVDVDRVSAALESAGLVAVLDTPGNGAALTLELVGLARYEALERVLTALRGPLGATRVTTLEFERERQLLSVEGPFDAAGLAARIGRLRDQRLVLEPIALDEEFGRLRVLGRWFPASDG